LKKRSSLFWLNVSDEEKTRRHLVSKTVALSANFETIRGLQEWRKSDMVFT
jgi:hypothetical protein